MVVLVDSIQIASLTMPNSRTLSPMVSTTQTNTGYLMGSTIDYDNNLDLSSSSNLVSQYSFTSRPLYINHSIAPGSHTLSFILCDLEDALLDSAVFINNVGAIPGSNSTTPSFTSSAASVSSIRYPSSVASNSPSSTGIQSTRRTLNSTSGPSLVSPSTFSIQASSTTRKLLTSSMKNSISSSPSSSIKVVTRTVLTTTTNTVISCAASITNCPGRDRPQTSLTLESISPPQASSFPNTSSFSDRPSLLKSSSSSTSIKVITETIWTTNVNTVISCAASITKCPGRSQPPTSSTIVLISSSHAASFPSNFSTSSSPSLVTNSSSAPASTNLGSSPSSTRTSFFFSGPTDSQRSQTLLNSTARPNASSSLLSVLSSAEVLPSSQTFSTSIFMPSSSSVTPLSTILIPNTQVSTFSQESSSVVASYVTGSVVLSSSIPPITDQTQTSSNLVISQTSEPTDLPVPLTFSQPLDSIAASSFLPETPSIAEVQTPSSSMELLSTSAQTPSDVVEYSVSTRYIGMGTSGGPETSSPPPVSTTVLASVASDILTFTIERQSESTILTASSSEEPSVPRPSSYIITSTTERQGETTSSIAPSSEEPTVLPSSSDFITSTRERQSETTSSSTPSSEERSSLSSPSTSFSSMPASMTNARSTVGTDIITTSTTSTSTLPDVNTSTSKSTTQNSFSSGQPSLSPPPPSSSASITPSSPPINSLTPADTPPLTSIISEQNDTSSDVIISPSSSLSRTRPPPTIDTSLTSTTSALTSTTSEQSISSSDVIVSPSYILSSTITPPSIAAQQPSKTTPAPTQPKPQNPLPSTPANPNPATSTLLSTTRIAEYTTITVAQVHTPAPPRILSTKTVTVCPACTAGGGGTENPASSLHAPSALAGIRTPYYAPHEETATTTTEAAETSDSTTSAPAEPPPPPPLPAETPTDDAQILHETTSADTTSTTTTTANTTTASAPEPPPPAASTANSLTSSQLTASSSSASASTSDNNPPPASSTSSDPTAGSPPGHRPAATIAENSPSLTMNPAIPPISNSAMRFSSGQTGSGSAVLSAQFTSSTAATPLTNPTTSIIEVSSGISALARCSWALASGASVLSTLFAMCSYL